MARVRAVLAELSGPDELAAAIHFMRERGWLELEVYAPYRTEAIEGALGKPPSRLPLAVFAGGLIGAGGAYGLQWLLQAYLYPINVGGRPAHYPTAFVPITFEMGVLLGGFTAFVGVLIMARALRLWHPVFEVPGFERVTIDRFWLRLEADHDGFDLDRARGDFDELGPERVVLLTEEGPA